MTFEYIYLEQHGLTLEQFIDKLNEYGEEGYHLVQQENFGIFLLERQVFPQIAVMGETRVRSPWYYDPVLPLIMVFILVIVIAVLARDYHWV